MRRLRSVLWRMLVGLAAVLALIIGGSPAYGMSAMDVSSHQTGIDVQAADTDIVIAKATQGTSYVNPDCDRVVQDALRLGKATGVYHFADTSGSPQAEADFFVSQTRGYIGKGVMPILDWEPSQPWRTDWAKAWLDRVQAAYGTKPMIYMQLSTENGYDWSSVSRSDYGLWLAGGWYYNKVFTKDQAPQPYWHLRNWNSAAMWQYTSNGRVYAWPYGVDLSEFYGNMDAWNRYAKSHVTAPVSPPAAPAPAQASGCHTVVRGDTLSGIGWRYGVSWPGIAAANGIRSPYTIYPGQCIRVNGVASSGRFYVVRPGDTLWSIALAHGVSMGAIHGYRSGNPNMIYAGETLTW